MKTLFLLCICSFLITKSGATQDTRRSSYLVVRIYGSYDKKNQRSYFFIDADPGNPHATKIYNLVQWITGRKLNAPATYYIDRSDTTTVYYNYFQNVTEALGFLADQGWEWIEISGEYNLNSQDEVRIHS